jgi:hypothetical protein
MMEFSGEFTVDGTPEELWKYFTDPDILVDCAPGCNRMELESPSHILAGLAVGVGSVKPSFDVEAIVTKCERPNRLEIQATGEASRNSFEATASQELHDNGDGTTTVAWRAETEISGIIASLGERAIGSVTDKLVNEFFEDLEAHVNAGTPAESKLQAASSDELEAAEAAAAAEAATAGGEEGGLAGRALGKAVAVTSGEGPSSGQSFAAGVVLGVLGSSLLRRLRGTGRRQVPQGSYSDESAPATGGDDVQTRPAPAGATGPSLLTLGLTAALGAAGAIIWSQSQSDDAAESTGSSPSPATDRVEDAEATAIHQNGQATASGEEREPTAASDAASDNPLDRLESRP